MPSSVCNAGPPHCGKLLLHCIGVSWVSLAPSLRHVTFVSKVRRPPAFPGRSVLTVNRTGSPSAVPAVLLVRVVSIRPTAQPFDEIALKFAELLCRCLPRASWSGCSLTVAVPAEEYGFGVFAAARPTSSRRHAHGEGHPVDRSHPPTPTPHPAVAGKHLMPARSQLNSVNARIAAVRRGKTRCGQCDLVWHGVSILQSSASRSCVDTRNRHLASVRRTPRGTSCGGPGRKVWVRREHNPSGGCASTRFDSWLGRRITGPEAMSPVHTTDSL